MNLTSRLQHLESIKPQTATEGAKLKLLQYLQTIADRRGALTPEEERLATDWFTYEWPQHLERIRRNAD